MNNTSSFQSFWLCYFMSILIYLENDKKSVDPDQLASSEDSCSGSTLFSIIQRYRTWKILVFSHLANDKTVWILISWLHQKTAALDLHCFLISRDIEFGKFLFLVILQMIKQCGS